MFTLAIGAGLMLFSPFLAFTIYPWSPSKVGGLGRAAIYQAAFALLLLAMIGTALGIRMAKSRRRTGWRRGLTVIAGVAVVWLPVLGFRLILPNLIRSHMAADESAAIAACKFYTEAQDLYRRTDWDGDGILEYSQGLEVLSNRMEQVMITASPHDQLECLRKAESSREAVWPWRGYVFKVLKSQGPHTPGGRKSYLVNGADGKERMTLGYALVAAPAEYGLTGINTFVINNTGTVYQYNYGEETESVFEQMTEYDPIVPWSSSE
ncbi:MAG: DUF2950 family protein [Planctomycetes bacterium]|nr:DUF2950 family protein [Planctomycetota bacterium]